MFRAYGSFPSNGDHGDVTTTKTTENAISTTETSPTTTTTTSTPSPEIQTLTNNKQIDLFDIILNQNTTNTTNNLLWNSNNNATISCSLINDFNNLLVSTSQISSRHQQQQQYQSPQEQLQYNQQSLDNLYGIGGGVTKKSTIGTPTTATTTSQPITGVKTNGISTNINKNHNNRYNFTGNAYIRSKSNFITFFRGIKPSFTTKATLFSSKTSFQQLLAQNNFLKF